MLLSPASTSVDTSLCQLIFIGYSHETALPIIGSAGFIDNFKQVFIPNVSAAADELSLLITPEATTHSAIIMNARAVYLEDKNNILVHLKNHRYLSAVPVVVIADRFHLTESTKYISAGADDFYDAPVFWEEMFSRLSFLAQFKQEIIHSAKQLDTSFLKESVVKVPVWKRLVDITAGVAGIVALSPVMLLTAIAIRLESKGPVIYRSTRIGAGYQAFNFWKFRSMYQDADSRLAQMIESNQYGQNATFQKFKNDPRVTLVGRFIRKYSIDELPQLYNILRGDMSVVGNRPLPVYEAAQLVSYEAGGRFLAPAGLTGLWQVNKRGNENMEQKERIALDLQYADTRTVWTDVRIIAKTFTAFVQKENV